MYQIALNYSNKIFFQNPDDKALFETLNIIGESNDAMVINGSGVDLDYYSVVPLPENTSFLMITRLLGDKGVREYVEAAKQVQKDYPNVTYSLVGWIDENPDAVDQKELDEWINVGAINFLGKVGDVRPAIKNCSVYVLPTFYREGTPRSILEALSIGRAIITTDTPGCRETVIQGKNGYLIEPKSVSKLVESMMKFINNPTIVERMGVESRNIAEKKYDVHKVNDFMFRNMKIE